MKNEEISYHTRYVKERKLRDEPFRLMMLKKKSDQMKRINNLVKSQASNHRKSWTAREIIYLFFNFGIKTYRELAIKLERSPYSIRNKSRRLNLMKIAPSVLISKVIKI